MEMPKGEGLYLTIDRVVERGKCGFCEGSGKAPGYPDHPGWGPMLACPRCDGHGRFRVRVRGWFELNYMYDFDFEDFSLDLLRSDNDSSFYYGGPLEEAQDAIVAAYFAKTLPLELAAHITEEDCDE